MGCRLRSRRSDDRGALFPLTAVLVVVMAMVMFSLASYATTGLRASKASAAAQVATAAARRGIDLAVHQYGHDVWLPCTSLGPLAVPTAIKVETDVMTMTCAPAGDLDGHPLVKVASQATVATVTVTYLAVVQVSVDGEGASLLSAERI